MEEKYRHLTQDEINKLIKNNCRCYDWNDIMVASNFTCDNILNVNFSGKIKLGVFNKKDIVLDGIVKHPGIFNASINNCTIGNDVYINQVRNYISNYIVEDDVIIEDVDILSVNEESTFGNGTVVSVLCETGGREIKICDFLSAQIAHVYVMYRDRTQTIAKLDGLVEAYAESVRSSVGRIGNNSMIVSTRMINNTKIGPYSRIVGASRLNNVSINSRKEAPTFIGNGVIIKDSIISTNCEVYDNALIYNCFIGQGCEIGEQFSAEQSLFFANCIGLHGEACAIFAGPYTVTHHKNTLLIAGMYSFMNAGSGTNFSNHMYKLGPIHQGILERGIKTASDSYVKWPAKVGPFTVVMGRHYHNSDTSNFPFSYLIEKNDESVLVPGVNLRSVGTVRDAQKWPKRDRRTDPDLLDSINFNLLSPFTINRVIKGKEILQTLKELSGNTSSYYAYSSTRINNSSMQTGLTLYEIAIIKFLGNSIISRLENRDCSTNEKMVESLKPETNIGDDDWIDVSGLIAPKNEIRKVFQHIDDGTYNTFHKINEAFKDIHSNYYTYEWTWALKRIEEYLHKSYTKFTKTDVIDLIKKWENAVVDLDNRLLADAMKEFGETVKIGFGADGDISDRDKDFNSVRGDYETNTFVVATKKHIETKTALGEKMIKKLS
ncbi:MAG: DUF4954 family protein [Bacteroidales bacterium]|nr:DUF4954 family protein [Bacteroidales bacterium]